jgi:hypothetical protein
MATKLNEIRLFRNRVYHNEPICFLNNRINFAHVQRIIQTIYDLLSWIEPDLVTYVNYFDNINSKIAAGMTL